MKPKQTARYLISLISISTALLLSAGCVSNLKYSSPRTTNLSGVWLIDKAASEEVVIRPNSKPIRSGEIDTGNPNSRRGEETIRRSRIPPTDGHASFSAFDKPPVMSAVEMTIEQDALSMGIAYPGKVYRDVDWGKTQRHGVNVTAGWSNNSLVIHVDDGAMDYIETYSLDPSGEILSIVLQLNGNSGVRKFTRVFIRKAGV